MKYNSSRDIKTMRKSMVWLLKRSKDGMILILERCRTMCGQSQIYDLINSDRCSRDVKMLWFCDSKGAEMIWFCQSIQIWCLLSGTGVLILQFPARSTCQIRTLERRMATKPNWTKISALSYYMRGIADLCPLSPRETHDISRVKNQTEPNLQCLLSRTGVLILRLSAWNTCQMRRLERRMTTRPNWTKISAFSYYMRTIADLWSMSPREAFDVSRDKTNQISYVFYRGPVC